MSLSRRAFVAGTATAPFALPSLALGQAGEGAPWLGVSLAGPEFGTHKAGFSNLSPGIFDRDYTFNHEPTSAYFCKQGLRLLRIPVRWERLQPRLGQALNGVELARLRTAVGWAGKNGGQAIIDVHNSAVTS